MIAPSVEEVVALAPRSIARLLRDRWIAHGLGPERTAPVDPLLAAVIASEDAPPWRALALAVWSDAGLRAPLAGVPGLRTRLWSAGCGGLFPAITALVAEAITQASGIARLVGVQDGRLWLPDALFRDFVYHLEMSEQGTGIGWSDIADAEALLEQPQGCQRVWRAWQQWAAEGTAPAHGFLAHPQYVGAVLGRGLPVQAPCLAGLRSALHARPAHVGPLLVEDRPRLLPWLPAQLPTMSSLITTIRSADERRTVMAIPSAVGYRAAAASDARLALLGLLAQQEEREPARAVVALMQRVALHLAAAGQVSSDGLLHVQLCSSPAVPPVWLGRCGDRLLVEADGLAGMATWLGLFPPCYRMQPDRVPTWHFSTLARCGWSELAEHGHWEMVRAHLPVAGGGERSWIRFPPGQLPNGLLPELSTPWQAATTDTGVDEMSLDAPWHRSD